MLGGKPTTQALHTKAAETKGLVSFALEMLRQKQSRLPGADTGFLLAAGEALQEYFNLMADAPRNVPPATLQKMHDAVKRHLLLSRRAGVPMRPKHHLMIHLVARTAKHGNPSYYATFTDEGVNRLLKKVGAAAHRSVWEVRCLIHFDKVEETRSAGKRSLPQ